MPIEEETRWESNFNRFDNSIMEWIMEYCLASDFCEVCNDYGTGNCKTFVPYSRRLERERKAAEGIAASIGTASALLSVIVILSF